MSLTARVYGGQTEYHPRNKEKIINLCRKGDKCEFFAKLACEQGKGFQKTPPVSHKNEMSLTAWVYGGQTEYHPRNKEKIINLCRKGDKCEFFAKLACEQGKGFQKTPPVSHKNEMSLVGCVYADQTEYHSRNKEKIINLCRKGDKCEFFAKLSAKESGK